MTHTKIVLLAINAIHNPLMLETDNIFKRKRTIEPFSFNQEVADVFDDMVERSVPFYKEIHRIILDILGKSFMPGDKIYDLGCSTGTTIKILHDFIKERFPEKYFEIVGVDNSQAMLKKCQDKLLKNKVSNFSLSCADLEKIELAPSRLTIMNYTLQFINPIKRPELLNKIYNNLRPGGVFILSEKIKAEDNSIDDLLTDLYYDFKRRNGYSELEIAQKREALENVLLPITPNNQIELLKMAGFSRVEVLFRWYNFACYLGVK